MPYMGKSPRASDGKKSELIPSFMEGISLEGEMAV
jgi:hypothetical protein